MTPLARKSIGSHYTPLELARFVAQKISEHCDCDSPSVLDPACGDGELLAAFQEFAPSARLVGYDLDPHAVKNARRRIEGRIEVCDFLDVASSYRESDLFDEPHEKFDVVIANPPYVRTQVLGAERSQRIAQQFGLEGRIDLYFAFIEGISRVLRSGGVTGIITSNRFMTTKAGEIVRARILEQFEVIHIFDLGDSKLFDAVVLPAVLLLRKKGLLPSPLVARMSSIYSTKSAEPKASARSPIEALATTGDVIVDNTVFQIKHGTLDYSNGVWRVATESVDQWLATVCDHTALVFGDLGKIRVGVKTTADKVFVRKHWADPKPELLRPLVTHHVARRYKSLPTQHQILYTHQEQAGKRIVVDLNQYPEAQRYLESHRETLTARDYVTKANRQWFEIWVPQQPSLWKRPKLIFQDICEKPTFWISLEEEIVQGDCYWLALNDQVDVELLWLALAVANSHFIEEFYDHSFHNKLYSGRRRFMTQYVEQFPLPDPATPLARAIVAKVKRIYELTPGDEALKTAIGLEQDIYQAFGIK